jgi:glyoxylase-like metal-dependent hydrolase (beta-lactamase superfamily II)
MIEVKKNIFLIPGRNGSLFPYSNGLYIKGSHIRVLIDAGMGRSETEACIRSGLDLVILSHCHHDHRSSIDTIPSYIPIWCHELEIALIENRDFFIESTGISRSGLNCRRIFGKLPFHKVHIAKPLHDLEEIDIGGLLLQIIHIPGHSPGHIAIHVPEEKFLFSADISLSPFGPFYGHDFGNIDDSIQSIRRLKGIESEMVITGHFGPFASDIGRRFSEYEEIIYRRNRFIISLLSEARALDDICGTGIIYPTSARLTRVMKWWERVHLEKNLNWLTARSEIQREGNFYRK